MMRMFSCTCYSSYISLNLSCNLCMIGMRSVRHCEPAPVPSLVVPDGIASIPQVVQHVVIGEHVCIHVT